MPPKTLAERQHVQHMNNKIQKKVSSLSYTHMTPKHKTPSTWTAQNFENL